MMNKINILLFFYCMIIPTMEQAAAMYEDSAATKITKSFGRKELAKANNPRSIANSYNASLQSAATATQAQNNAYNLNQAATYNEYLSKTAQEKTQLNQQSLSQNQVTQDLDSFDKNIHGINLSNKTTQQGDIEAASADILGANN